MHCEVVDLMDIVCPVLLAWLKSSLKFKPILRITNNLCKNRTLSFLASPLQYYICMLYRKHANTQYILVMEIKNQSIGITGYPLSNPDLVEPDNTTPNLIKSRSRNYRS